MCKFCENTVRKIDDDFELIGGYPLSFDLEKCQGSIHNFAFANINKDNLVVRHIRAGGSNFYLKSCKINYCHICGHELIK